MLGRYSYVPVGISAAKYRVQMPVPENNSMQSHGEMRRLMQDDCRNLQMSARRPVFTSHQHMAM